MSRAVDASDEDEAPLQNKPLFWMGSSLDDLRDFPLDVRREMGFAFRQAQQGGRHVHAKPLRGHKGASVLEVVTNSDGDTYRGVYTVKFKGAVYVLHAFQKKSKRGIKTPKPDLDLIESRLAQAKEHYESWSESEGSEADGDAE